LAAAAQEGRSDVVHFLLMNGADPTLEGSSDEDPGHPIPSHLDAFKAAQQCGKDKPGKDLVSQLLTAVKPFWNPAEYGKPRYDKTRVSKGFPNWPKDFQVMRDVLRDIWAKAEDRKQLVSADDQITKDVNANIPPPLSEIVKDAIDRMSINLQNEDREGNKAKVDLSQLSGRRNILPKGLNPFNKQEMLQAIRTKEEAKKKFAGGFFDQNQGKENSKVVASPAERHRQFRSKELGHSTLSEFGNKLLGLMPECLSGAECAHAQWNLRATFDAALPETVRKSLAASLDFSLDNPHHYFRRADQLTTATARVKEQGKDKQDKTGQSRTRDATRDKVNTNGVCWKHQRFGHRSWECLAPGVCKMGRRNDAGNPKVDRNGLCWKHQRYGYRSWDCAAPGHCVWSQGAKSTFGK